MEIQFNKKHSCCIVGRTDIPPGYEPVLEYEFNNLIARGVTDFLFSGVGPFERLCLETLQMLQQCYSYIPIRLILIGADAHWLANYEDDFDEILCLCRKSHPRLRPNRYTICHSRFLFYFQQTDFGGAFSDVRYGRDMGLHLVNAAKSKRKADKQIPASTI